MRALHPATVLSAVIRTATLNSPSRSQVWGSQGGSACHERAPALDQIASPLLRGRHELSLRLNTLTAEPQSKQRGSPSAKRRSTSAVAAKRSGAWIVRRYVPGTHWPWSFQSP